MSGVYERTGAQQALIMRLRQQAHARIYVTMPRPFSPIRCATIAARMREKPAVVTMLFAAAMRERRLRYQHQHIDAARHMVRATQSHMSRERAGNSNSAAVYGSSVYDI